MCWESGERCVISRHDIIPNVALGGGFALYCTALARIEGASEEWRRRQLSIWGRLDPSLKP